MRSPSGLQAGPPSAPGFQVRRRGGALPSEGTSQRSLSPLFSSTEKRLIVKTTCLLSGESAGAPARSMAHRSSGVMGRFAEAATAKQRKARAAKRGERTGMQRPPEWPWMVAETLTAPNGSAPAGGMPNGARPCRPGRPPPPGGRREDGLPTRGSPWLPEAHREPGAGPQLQVAADGYPFLPVPEPDQGTGRVAAVADGMGIDGPGDPLRGHRRPCRLQG